LGKKRHSEYFLWLLNLSQVFFLRSRKEENDLKIGLLQNKKLINTTLLWPVKALYISSGFSPKGVIPKMN
jgi:hypothetical protein